MAKILRGFVESAVLPMLERDWCTYRWVHHLETAMLFCQEYELPPPTWLTEALATALHDRSVDQEKLGLRIRKHGHRYILVWMLMSLHDHTLDEACAKVAEEKGISEETVRKSYQDFKKRDAR